MSYSGRIEDAGCRPAMIAVDWQWWMTKLADPHAYVRQAMRELNVVVGFLDANARFPAFYICIVLAVQLVVLAAFLVRRRHEPDRGAQPALLSRANIVLAVKRVFAYAFPKEIVFKRSFLIDVQFWLLGTFGVLTLIAKALAVIFLLDQLPGLFARTGLDQIAAVGLVRSFVGGLEPKSRQAIIFLVAFISYDFASYWAHRLAHTKFLWHFHKVHHYPEQVNILAGFRFHPLDNPLQLAITGLITSIAITIVAPLDKSNFYSTYNPYLDPTAWWYASFVFYSAYFGRLVHSHFPIFFGRFFGKILVSPAFHMVHHSKIVIDQNFGSTLAIWDYLFGTHHDVRNLDEFNHHLANLGVRGMPDNVYKNVLHATWQPMVDAWRMLIQPFRRHVAESPLHDIRSRPELEN
jgi:sterol desaturase/sphingolipid hydroxylase (fatty acid hydroxylase superfamily)